MNSRKVRKKRKLGSYPFASVVFSITLALLVVGLFGLLVSQTKSLTKIIQENVEFQVFLKKDLTQVETTRIQRIVTNKPFVLTKEGTPKVSFVTREEAAKQFISDTGEDFTRLLGENPLRDLLVVNIDPAYQHPDSLAALKQELRAMRGVYEVNYVESLVQSINQNLTKIGLILSGIALILIIVVVILINNTIKLALFSQRFLIRSMQLVGATSGFIKRPFLLRSILFGAMGGILSMAILYGVYQSALNRIPDLILLYDVKSLLVLGLGVVFIGIFVTYLSTFFAVNRYLQTSLDELY